MHIKLIVYIKIAKRQTIRVYWYYLGHITRYRTSRVEKVFWRNKSGFYRHHDVIVPLMCVAGASQDNHFARKSRALEKSLTRGMRFCSANALPLEIKSRATLLIKSAEAFSLIWKISRVSRDFWFVN